MEIMEVEAKKKKEEKYTNARLDRHQTKWYQRDEDTKQASLEAIMKNEQAEAKKREEEKKMLNDERKRKEKAKKSSVYFLFLDWFIFFIFQVAERGGEIAVRQAVSRMNSQTSQSAMSVKKSK